MGLERVVGVGYSPTAPTEKYTIMKRAGYAPAGGMPMFVYCHSARGDAREVFGYLAPYVPGGTTGQGVFEAIALAGYMVIAADLGGEKWANNAVIGDGAVPNTNSGLFRELATFGVANGGRTGGLQVGGGSMGGGTALALAFAQPALVKSATIFSPATSWADLYTRLGGIDAAAMDASYPPAYNDATHGLTHSPEHFGSSNGCPIQWFSSPDDNTCIWSKDQATRALFGSRVEHHQTAGDHGTAQQWDAVSIPTVLGFLDSHKND